MWPWRGTAVVVLAGAVVGAVVRPLTVHGGPPPETGRGKARLFFLDGRERRVLTADPDGSHLKRLLVGRTALPDGIAVDTAAGHLYWTSMGRPDENDGTIERADLDGTHLTTIVPAGGTFTPKQLKLDLKHGKLYWSDREGMRLMRANLDGSGIETLLETARGEAARLDARNWCVGLALDVEGGKVYWTQKGGNDAGQGSLRRAGIEVPRGESPDRRSDVEVLFAGLPEPIDLDLDLGRRLVYWTDRGDPPRGNTVSRAPMDPPPGADPALRQDQEILLRGLHEAIGLSLDLAGGRMYVTDFEGSVYSARLDGSDPKTLVTGQGRLTGIAYVELPR